MSLQALASRQTDIGASAFFGAITQLVATGVPIKAVVPIYGSQNGLEQQLVVPADSADQVGAGPDRQEDRGQHARRQQRGVLDTWFDQEGLTKEEQDQVTLVVLPPLNTRAGAARRARSTRRSSRSSATSRPPRPWSCGPSSPTSRSSAPTPAAASRMRTDFIEQNPTTTQDARRGRREGRELHRDPREAGDLRRPLPLAGGARLRGLHRADRGQLPRHPRRARRAGRSTTRTSSCGSTGSRAGATSTPARSSRPTSTPTSTTPTRSEAGPMSSRIQLKRVGQTFWVRGDEDKRLREFVALDGVDLDIEAGEFVTLVGPSGCGKSTILDLIAGLAKPSGGTLTVDGTPITGPGLDRSVVFQQYTLLPWRTAQANIELALEAKGGLTRRRARRARAHVPRPRGPDRVRQPLPARALRWHEAARRDRPQPVLRARGAAHGRAVRRPRRADPGAPAGGAPRRSGSGPAPRSSSSPTTSTRPCSSASGSR